MSQDISDPALLVFTLLVIATICTCFYMCYKGSCKGQKDQANENGDTAEENRSNNADGSLASTRPRTATAITTPNSQPTTELALVKFSPERLQKVPVPCNISEQEEMAWYQQDQKWLQEAREIGVKTWQMRMHTKFDHDLQGKKNFSRFICTYGHVLERSSLCMYCRERLKEKVEWFRCRECVDVDFCVKCYERGPTIPTYGHVPSHGSARVLVKDTCFSCKAFISNTNFKCESCDHILFCLGCYISGRLAGHEYHPIRKSRATSYVLVSPEVAPSELHPLLPPAVLPSIAAAALASSGGACHPPDPDDPPPPYEQCIPVTVISLN